MGKGRKGERTVSKGKKQVTFRWWSDWTVVWVIGGFGLIYLIFVPLKAHPFHWLFSFLGAVVGYSVGLLFETGIPSKVARFSQYSLIRVTLKQDRDKQAKGKR